jgi:group II intron reverse transcriptase/maturase
MTEHSQEQSCRIQDVSGVTILTVLKAHSLTGRITEDLMHKAFKAVKKNRGAAGVDRVSIWLFELKLEQNLKALMQDLKDGTFWPFPLRRKNIPKEPGKFRPLGIPAVRDRVAQEVVRRLIESYFLPYFSPFSYGFIPGRSCRQAVYQVNYMRMKGYVVVLDADIQKFFDNIPHHIIMKLVAKRIADGNILRLIEKFLTSGVMEDGVYAETTIGTPQGGVISPLLANIVLDVLDKELAKAGYVFVRYADDFLVLAKTRPEIEKALEIVRGVIEGQLELKLSPEKTKIVTFGDGFDFLGFHFCQVHITMRAKSIEKVKEKIRTLTIRSHSFSDDVIQEINSVVRGVANYFYAGGIASVRVQFQMLDAMIRRRLRCMMKKRIWLSDNRRIPNRFFEKHGLLSLRALTAK